MKVNLNIEEDDQFRTYVKELIGGQVRAILREQLAGIVASEIAKVRLLQPDSATLTELIEVQVKAQVATHLRQSSTMIREQLFAAVREAVTPVTKNIDSIIKAELIRAIEKST